MRRLTGPFGFALAFLVLASSVHSADEPFDYFHYRPKDHVLGDVHPYFHKGECFLYSLKPKTYDVALSRSKDLVNWTPAPVKMLPIKLGEWKSPYFVLGVLHDPMSNLFRSFYTYGRTGLVASSTSKDLVNWSIAPQDYSIPAAENYVKRRDPFVFWIPERNEYGCVMCTTTNAKTGSVTFTTSPDLRKWSTPVELINPGNTGDFECPQMFRLGDRWYLLASLFDRGVGQPSYWTGPKPEGPWPAARTGVLDGKDLCAAQLGFDNGTPVLFGWIPNVAAAANNGKQYWGGHLALPREVHALKDGTLGTRLHPGVAKQLAGKPAYYLATHTIDATPQVLDGQWGRSSLEVKLTMPKDVREVRFAFEPLGEVVLNRTERSLAIRDRDGKAGTKLTVDLPDDKPLPLRIVVDGDIVEVFLNDRYSLAARLIRTRDVTRLSFGTAGGSARMDELQIVKIAGANTKP